MVPTFSSISFSPAWIVEVNRRQWSKGRHFRLIPLVIFGESLLMNHLDLFSRMKSFPRVFPKARWLTIARENGLSINRFGKMSRPLSTSWTCSPLENDTRGLTLDSRSSKFFERYFLEIFPLRFQSLKRSTSSEFYRKVTSLYYKYYQRRFHYVFHYESKIIICLQQQQQ